MGGSARRWETFLPADLVAGSTLRLRLVLTKFGPPSVRIAYAIRVEPEAPPR